MSLVTDVHFLASLVSETEQIPADNAQVSDADLELLARLDDAVTMADGVEARLDEILGTLDTLLTNLGPKDGVQPQETLKPHSESQPEPSREQS